MHLLFLMKIQLKLNHLLLLLSVPIVDLKILYTIERITQNAMFAIDPFL